MSSIGLKRGTVKIIRYDKKWKTEFKKEESKILDICGDKIISIEHIGSTAVPYLSAKPIVDISVGIKRFKDVEDLIKPLTSIGYHFYKKFQKQMLFCKGPDSKRTHYLHVMRFNGVKWKNDLLFRDYLRTHTKER